MDGPIGSPVPRSDPSPERKHGQRATGGAMMDGEGFGHANGGLQRPRPPPPPPQAHAPWGGVDGNSPPPPRPAVLQHPPALVGGCHGPGHGPAPHTAAPR